MKRKLVCLILVVFFLSPLVFANIDIHLTEPTNQYQESASGWLSGWGWRREISIVGVSGAGENYPINFTTSHYTDMQPDFDDVRFTETDGTTELDYWLETYTASTSAKFWVEVTDNLDSNQAIYMYYGNDAVSTTSDGTEVFYFFDDFEDNNLANNWLSVGACWSSSTTQKKYGSWSAYGDSDTTDRTLKQNYNVTAGTIFHTWLYIEDGVGAGYDNYLFHSASGYIAYTYEDDICHYDGGPQPYLSSCLSTGTWYEVEIGYYSTGPGEKLTCFLDGVQGNIMTSNVAATYLQIRAQTDNVVDHDFYIDDWYIRNWYHLGEPIPTISATVEYEMLWHTVETRTIIIDLWVGVSEATLWLMDSFLIIAGLVLIPTSTLYLVKGGKDDMDTDKLFYFCVVFMVGWALLIGGII